MRSNEMYEADAGKIAKVLEQDEHEGAQLPRKQKQDQKAIIKEDNGEEEEHALLPFADPSRRPRRTLRRVGMTGTDESLHPTPSKVSHNEKAEKVGFNDGRQTSQ